MLRSRRNAGEARRRASDGNPTFADSRPRASRSDPPLRVPSPGCLFPCAAAGPSRASQALRGRPGRRAASVYPPIIRRFRRPAGVFAAWHRAVSAFAVAAPRPAACRTSWRRRASLSTRGRQRAARSAPRNPLERPRPRGRPRSPRGASTAARSLHRHAHPRPGLPRATRRRHSTVARTVPCPSRATQARKAEKVSRPGACCGLTRRKQWRQARVNARAGGRGSPGATALTQRVREMQREREQHDRTRLVRGGERQRHDVDERQDAERDLHARASRAARCAPTARARRRRGVRAHAPPQHRHRRTRAATRRSRWSNCTVAML